MERINKEVGTKNNSKTNYSFPRRDDNSKAMFFQPKLTLGPVDDVYEREADTVADKVMRMRNDGYVQTSISPITIQRKCAACEEEEHLQRKEDGATKEQKAPAIVSEAIGSGGNPLDDHSRSFMESRFGYDFSNVKIHTDTVAAKSADSIHALAYTSGNNIVFNKGQYSPGTDSGNRLLAHELTHVVQQKGLQRKIQRCPDAASTAHFDTLVTQVRAHAQYTALTAADRAITEEIITLARSRDDCTHFIDRLLILFDTPIDRSASVGAAASAAMASAADAERDRLATPEGARLADVEERTARDPARQWETLSPPPRTWGNMGTFKIDRANPNNIVVQARIRVTGNATDVANIVAQEDGIEKAAQELGYTLDIIFVNKSGPNVFTVSVDPALPVDAGNWSAYQPDPSAYTHEIHHLLGLLDRYDYTDHADNGRMLITDRLHWFRIEAGRPPDPERTRSLMGSGDHLLNDDICNVSQLNFATCMASRQARTAMVTRARGTAFAKTFSVFEILSGIRPPSPRDDDRNELQQRRALSMSRTIFGQDINHDQLQDIVSTMRYRLTPGIALRFANSLDSNCTGNAYYVVNMMPPLALCPDFFTLSTDDQAKSFLRAAAQMARVDASIPVNLCADYTCNTPCGNFGNADTWAKFVWCASSI